MLMDCLSAGRGVSLPGMSGGGAQAVVRGVGAYTSIREQFGIPIGQFEGIQEPLTRIGGLTYVINASRKLTAGAVDAGEKPAVISAIVKAYLTGKGFDMVSNGLQVHGGSGFTEEWGASQLMRDARITLIYEGTNGIQALDLVGRKLAANGGRAVFTFFAEIDDFIGANEDNEELAPFIEGLKDAKAKLQDGTTWLMQNGMSNFNNAGAASTDYLHLFGLTALAYMWAKMAKTAVEKRGSDPYYDDKLVTGRYYVSRILPETAAHLAKLKTGAEPLMTMEADRF